MKLMTDDELSLIVAGKRTKYEKEILKRRIIGGVTMFLIAALFIFGYTYETSSTITCIGEALESKKGKKQRGFTYLKISERPLYTKTTYFFDTKNLSEY